MSSLNGTLDVFDGFAQACMAAKRDGVDAVVVSEPSDPTDTNQWQAYEDLMRTVEVRQLAALLVSRVTPAHSYSVSASAVDCVDPEVSLEELAGRLATIERYHAMVRAMDRKLRNMERMGKRLNEHFQEIDQEMRLAARLQREFLPDISKPLLNVKFASVYRPASWVSGDIYDVFRIDEEHIGFYLADAVGHGLAAGLLTMFIKRAIIPKKIEGDSYEVCTPSDVMANLNDSLADQDLAHCQFVTAFYGLLNVRTLKLSYARGGHPYPLLMDKAGGSIELKSPGGLLGLFTGETFDTREVQLREGEKLLLFTDGVETVFQDEDHESTNKRAYRVAFESWGRLPVEDLIARMRLTLDAEKGSLLPRDDVTVLGVEIMHP